VLDFTAALYLGLRHASRSLRPWEQLTLGAPAALAAPPGANEIAHRLAALIGCDRGTLAPSTLHLFWDLFGMLSGERVAIYLDAGVYPIARWGVERAAAHGVPLRTFPHHDAAALHQLLKHDQYRRRSPLVVADGFCPGCGRPAPITAYLDNVRAYGGQLIIDDTQALGIFGSAAGTDAPYGKGGGGSLRWHDAGGADVVVISSLAKSFGVPMAVLAGSEAMVDHFEAYSETRVHCSPPSIAVIHAAEHALNVNDQHGDALRLRLAQRVHHFRQRLAQAGLTASGELFPVQTLKLPQNFDAIDLHEQLRDHGIQTVLHRGRNGNRPRISFIVTARHVAVEIEQAVTGLTRIMQTASLRSQATYARHG
jgi:8-amino-7-oxononanoate synthase